MSLFDTLVVVVCGAVGFTLQGAVGFGMGILGSPILILIDSRLVPGPVLASSMVFTLFLTLRERHAIDVGGFRWAVLGRVAGTIPAAGLVAVLPSEQLGLLFGGIVLLAVAISVAGPRVELGPVSLVVAGVLSGVMGTIASIGGPPLALLYQHAPGARVRGTLSSIFLAGSFISLVALSLVGRFGRDELRLTLALLPGVVFGLVVSRRLASRLDRGYTRRAVLTVATAAGVIVVVRYVLG